VFKRKGPLHIRIGSAITPVRVGAQKLGAINTLGQGSAHLHKGIDKLDSKCRVGGGLGDQLLFRRHIPNRLETLPIGSIFRDEQGQLSITQITFAGAAKRSKAMVEPDLEIMDTPQSEIEKSTGNINDSEYWHWETDVPKF